MFGQGLALLCGASVGTLITHALPAAAIDAETELAIERHVAGADEETVEAVATIEEYARNVTRLTG